MESRLSRAVVVVGVAAALFVSFGYGVGVGARRWPPYSLLKSVGVLPRDVSPGGPRRDDGSREASSKEDAAFRKEVPSERLATGRVAAEIARIVQGQAGSSKTEEARFVRQFVYGHSVHRMDDQRNRYAGDMPTALSMLHDHYLTGRNPPNLSCGPRARAMQAILDALAIENRMVHVFSDDYEGVQSHTFLEVRDPPSGRWTVHDPDYDVTYVDARSGAPVSLLRLILGDLESVVPLSGRGRGWEANHTKHLKEHFFEAAKYDAREGAADVIVVNTDRFSIGKRFPADAGATFLEFSEKHYRRPAFLLNHTIPRLEGNPAPLRGKPNPEDEGAAVPPLLQPVRWPRGLG